MANTYTASSGVRLFDVRSSGVLLYPETSLPMVQMETFGGVVSSGTSLGLDAQSAWDSGLDDIVSGSYCPLSKVIDGNTQYADMYTAGGTATVTDIGTSTGYGTLLNTVEVTTVVRGYDSATDDLIPTEKAVAAGLATKQEVLSAGSGIDLVPDGYGTTVLSVNGAIAVADLTNASQDLYPTEYAVRFAINAAADNAQNNAVNIVTSQIAAAGYANSAWCLNTFLQKGESPEPTPGDVPYANYDTAGKVMPLESHGLVLGGQGSMNLMVAPIYSTHDSATAAASYYVGGVKVLNAFTGVTSDYQLSAYVPNTYAVHDYCYTNYVSKTDYAVKSNGAVAGKAGIVEPFAGLSMTSTSRLSVIPATSNLIGGVMVPSNKGLTLGNTGSLTLSAAPVGASTITYASAVTSVTNGLIGGAYVMNHVESATAAAHKSRAIVPSVDAVWSYGQENFISNTTSAAYVDTSNGSQVGTTVIPLGGVRVWTSGGVAVNNGVLYLQAATDTSMGGIKVGSGLAMSASVTGGAADKLYLKSATTTSIGGVKVPTGSGLSLTAGTLKLSSATTTALGGVVVGAGLQVTDGTVSVAGGEVDASYNGPFAVSYDDPTDNTSVVNISGGYVKWLDGQLYVNSATNVIMPSTEFMYLTGSSGTVAGQQIVDTLYNIKSGTTVYSRTTSAAKNNRIKWGTTGGSAWIEDAVPAVNTVLYTNSTGDTSKGKVTSVVGYSISVATVEGGTATYPRIQSDEINGTEWGSATMTVQTQSIVVGGTNIAYKTGTVQDGRYNWVNGNGTGGVWTDSETPEIGDTAYRASTGSDVADTITGLNAVFNCTRSMLYTTEDKCYWTTDDEDTSVWTREKDPVNGTPVYGSDAFAFVIGYASNVQITAVYTAAGLPYTGTYTMPVRGDYNFTFTTSQPSLPPAGRFYTMLAQNSDEGGADQIVQHQYGTIWHEHWGDDYRGQFAVSRVTLSQETADAAVIGTYPYKYVVNGGRLYGGIDFRHGRLWNGSIISGGIILAPGDIEYPKVIISGTTYSDALYFPYGGTNEVWLNIWSGSWATTYGGPGGTTSSWHTVVHSQCLEGYIKNCYSVQLGWITVNGAPQQEHKGSIAIRGRWS